MSCNEYLAMKVNHYKTSNSCFIISSIKLSIDIFGDHLSNFFAFCELPLKYSTSKGLKYLFLHSIIIFLFLILIAFSLIPFPVHFIFNPIFFAVLLTNARLFPMTMYLIPILKNNKDSQFKYYFISHLIAVTAWVNMLNIYNRIDKYNRVKYFLGLGGSLWIISI